MGILIQFPQPDTHTPRGEAPSAVNGAHDVHFAAAYRRDVDRAVALLLSYIETDGYDGIALILKPTSDAAKPAFVVGGLYRHKLIEAVDATMQLHLAIKLRASEQSLDRSPRERRPRPTRDY